MGSQPEDERDTVLDTVLRRRARIAADLPPEEEYPAEDDDEEAPRRFDAWRRRSATGAVLTGFAFGLREVFEAERNEPPVVLQTSGLPPQDLAAEADLESPLPRKNVVRVRPWLVEGDDLAEGDEPGAGGEAARRTSIPARDPKRRPRKRRR